MTRRRSKRPALEAAAGIAEAGPTPTDRDPAFGRLLADPCEELSDTRPAKRPRTQLRSVEAWTAFFASSRALFRSARRGGAQSPHPIGWGCAKERFCNDLAPDGLSKV